eukprot:2084098-Rhodomonas_salina.1
MAMRRPEWGGDRDALGTALGCAEGGAHRAALRGPPTVHCRMPDPGQLRARSLSLATSCMCSVRQQIACFADAMRCPASTTTHVTLDASSPSRLGAGRMCCAMHGADCANGPPRHRWRVRRRGHPLPHRSNHPPRALTTPTPEPESPHPCCAY